MQCPYSPIQCDQVDTAGMDKMTECLACEHYPHPDPVEKLNSYYSTKELAGYLPKTVVQGKRTFFKMEQVFDLVIHKDGLDNWVVQYDNERSFQTIFRTINADLDRALAEMLLIMIEKKYALENILSTENKPKK